jgi:hypothetical protein
MKNYSRSLKRKKIRKELKGNNNKTSKKKKKNKKKKKPPQAHQLQSLYKCEKCAQEVPHLFRK